MKKFFFLSSLASFGKKKYFIRIKYPAYPLQGAHHKDVILTEFYKIMYQILESKNTAYPKGYTGAS